MATRHDAIPEHIWQAILEEVRQGSSYAEVARRWQAKIGTRYGGAPSASTISRRARRQVPAPPRRTKANESIYEMTARIFGDVPREVWDRLPEDGSYQHDHYLYGWPKRP